MITFLKKNDYIPVLMNFLDRRPDRIKNISTGLLNQNVLVSLGGTDFVFKIYRKEIDIKKIQEIHFIMEFAIRNGIPAPRPLQHGKLKGHVVALYPYIKGVNPDRYKNSEGRIRSMGKMLGEVQFALNKFHSKTPKPVSSSFINWEANSYIKKLLGISRSLARQPAQVRNFIKPVLEFYVETIQSFNWDKGSFSKLPVNMCHNDFHFANILMVKNKITAVLDWEKAGWNWRVFEVMRSVFFNCRKSASELDWHLVKTYLSEYRKIISLTPIERELAFECGYRKYLFDYWAIKQYLSGRKELRSHILRRLTLAKTLTKNRQEYSERISELFAG